LVLRFDASVAKDLFCHLLAAGEATHPERLLKMHEKLFYYHRKELVYITAMMMMMMHGWKAAIVAA